jgi:hypothetical protein
MAEHHPAAKIAALEIDGAWFGLHPDRCFRVRPSIAYEFESWGALTHLEKNLMLVRVERGKGRRKYRSYGRVGVVYRGDLPDDEGFLSRLFREHEAAKARGATGTQYLEPAEVRALMTAETEK